MYTILGAGLSGISIADHLYKKGIAYQLYESKLHGGGHIYSEIIDGFTWDEGPHVSFTQYPYVQNYFAHNCDNEFLEYSTAPTNYFKGNWIIHPAQSNMYAIPEPLRNDCISAVIKIRDEFPPNYEPSNYQDWMDFAFGKTFAKIFSKVYTEKYWATKPENLTTNWIGKRIYFPEVTDMVESAKGPIDKTTHYISTVRYPKKGGYYSFIKNVEKRLNICYNKELKYISFNNKELVFADGHKESYINLISTLPLPGLIRNSDAPEEIKRAAQELKCSQVLLVNVVVNHGTPVPNHWIYVYDEDYYSTRINFTEMLSPYNGKSAKSGIQVEVYFSAERPISESIANVSRQVLNELIEMKLIKGESYIDSFHTKWLNWANVIFDQARVSAQDLILAWLSTKGLKREEDDLLPMTDWIEKANMPLGTIILAGRFAQWKYYWTDDCVMRGKFISDNIQ